MGHSVCPSTNICHPLIEGSQPCDTNTCIKGQILVQNSNNTRYCSLYSSLPVQAQRCINYDEVYCLQLNQCSNITAPHLCQPCPSDLLSCPYSDQCVTNISHCCMDDSLYYCDILQECVSTNSMCKLPNVLPVVEPSSLIHIDSIDSYGSDLSAEYRGHMIGRILGNNGTGDIGTDSQGEEISIAITEYSGAHWQYSLCSSNDINICLSCQNTSTWVSINVSIIIALYLPNTACLRYNRQDIEEEGSVWLRVKLWDGNSDGYASNSTTLVRYIEPFYSNTLNYSTSVNSTVLVSLLSPISDSPIIERINDTPLYINEGTSLVNNKGAYLTDLISVTTHYLNETPADIIPGLIPPTYNESLLPVQARELYYSKVTIGNTLRHQRFTALSNGQSTGVAISLIGQTTDSFWQISFHNDPQLYIYLTDLLRMDQLLLVNTSVSLRLLPTNEYSGNASLYISAWDGVLPSSLSPIYVLNYPVYITPITDIDSLHISTQPEIITINVRPIPDSPFITSSTLLLPPLPYTLSYHHEEMYTVLIGNSVSSLRPDRERLQDILYLVLEQPVTIHRFYPASINQ